MSLQIKPLIVGLASPGLFWLATSVAFGQDGPATQGPPTSAPTSPATYRALLLTSGTVVVGDIVDFPAAKAYCLKASGGPVPYPKSRVLKAAGSVEELYQFQLSRLPGGDPDERIKLAKWCLTVNLRAQANEQLEAVEKMCPGDLEVKKMLYNLAATVKESPTRDPEVRRSSVDIPATLDPNVLKSRKRYNGLPQIFDLPPAQAVKRANEFAQYVQPVLQQSCVKCHNEKYQGNFQLVEARSQRDRNNTDILRANLDATLRLVSQDDPSRSELLSAGLVPHPKGNARAIFKGPNDAGYMMLVTWIKRVCPPSNPAGQAMAGDPGGRGGFNAADQPSGDGFAVDRSARMPNSPSFPSVPAGGSSLPGVPSQILQSGMNVENYNENADFVRSPDDNPQFPAPFVIGGAQVTPPAPPRSRVRPPASSTPPSPQSTTPTVPEASTQMARPIGPNAVSVAPTDNLKQLPGMDKPLYPTPPSKDEAASPDDPKAPEPPRKKPKKIDDALLERMMKARNGGGTP